MTTSKRSQTERRSIMTESRKIVWRQTARIAIGEVVCLGIMYGVYALLHKLGVRVIAAGVVGGTLAVANFFFMAVVATLAADKAQQQDVQGGEKLMKNAYPLRVVALAAALIACAASGFFDVPALLLPLLFVRPVIMLWEFIGKKGE